MSDNKPNQDRKQRLSQALRDNLRKRKQQARNKKTQQKKPTQVTKK